MKKTLRKIYAISNPQLVVKPEKTEVTSLFAGVSLLFSCWPVARYRCSGLARVP